MFPIDRIKVVEPFLKAYFFFNYKFEKQSKVISLFPLTGVPEYQATSQNKKM
jgi:hypothetical protein